MAIESEAASGLSVDANLLVLLVVRVTDKNLISTHKRVRRKFDTDDSELLCSLMRRFPRLLVTPNTLTESSNLLPQFLPAHILDAGIPSLLAAFDHKQSDCYLLGDA